MLRLVSERERGAWARSVALVLVYRGASLGLWWFFAWLLFYEAMEPRGTGFALALLYLSASLCGALLKAALPRLPPLLGMLVAGILLKNVSTTPLQADHLLLGEPFDWCSP